MKKIGINSSSAASDLKLVLKRLEEQPCQQQEQSFQNSFSLFLGSAQEQGEEFSDQCNLLCSFVEQCNRSQSSTLQKISTSEKVGYELFCLFLELRDKNLHRSMRRILGLVSTLLIFNHDKALSNALKDSIIKRTLSVICHQSSKPSVKLALKSLEFFLGKGTILISELILIYRKIVSFPKASLCAEGNTSNFYCDHFISEIFKWMSMSEISPTAGKLLVIIFQETRNYSQNSSFADISLISWQNWIQRAIQKEPYLLENVKNHLLPTLFSSDRLGSLEFLEDLNRKIVEPQPQSKEFDTLILLRLTALEIGKKMGLVTDPANMLFKAPIKSSKYIVLDENKLEPLLSHASPAVRSLSYSVLVSSASPLKPFSPLSLRIIESKIHILYSDTDVKFRNEILSTSKKLIERLRGSTTFLYREIISIKSQLSNGTPLDTQALYNLEQAQSLLYHQRHFIRWILEFLLGELVPTASYQRHFTSLKTISLWISSGILKNKADLLQAKQGSNETAWSFFIFLFSPEALRLLMDLLVDPFEDIRNLASSILENWPSCELLETENSSDNYWREEIVVFPNFTRRTKPSSFGTELDSEHCERLAIVENFLKRAEMISNKTGRADYADGLAKAYKLYYSLQLSDLGRLELLSEMIESLDRKVKIAKKSLSQAVQAAPIHGNFATLNLIWESINPESLLFTTEKFDHNWLYNIQQRIVDLCCQIWISVGHILCNDSPEGHIPEEDFESEVTDSKNILSYSFRAIHESSKLLRTLVRKIVNYAACSLTSYNNLFSIIGDITFDQLSKLRHRGALSTVSLTFITCCELVPKWQINVAGPRNTLDKWLEGAFVCLQTQFSTTRRSAGIPSILTAIMSVMAKNDFEKTFIKLLKISESETEYLGVDQEQLPQVHALNCLKEVIKSTSTSSKVNAYISESFEVVGKNIGSPIWAIRNSSLILLRSLIDNLMGTSDSKSTSETGWDGKSTKIQYEKYPTLSRMLLQLLQNERNAMNEGISYDPAALPAIGIIRRAGPPPELREHLYDLLFEILKSKVWHLREQAARAISTIQERTTELETVKTLLNYSRDSSNEQHGSILAAKFIVERIITTSYPLDCFNNLYIEINRQIFKIYNPSVLSEYLGIGNIVLGHILTHSDLNNKEEFDVYIRKLSERCWDSERSECLLQHLIELQFGSASVMFRCYQEYIKQKFLIAIILKDNFTAIHLIYLIRSFGSDMIVSILEHIISAFKNEIHIDSFIEIHPILIRVLEINSEAAVICCVVDMVSYIFTACGEDLTKRIEIFQPLIERLEDSIISVYKITPALVNVGLKFSGYSALLRLSTPSLTRAEKSQFIQNWARTLERASQTNQNFDSRYAAAHAIQAFYACNHVKLDRIEIKKVTSKLDLILVTLLVDDDEQIRHIAAMTVSSFLGRSFAPLAALDALFKYRIPNTDQCDQFSWVCLHQIIVFDLSTSKCNPLDPGIVLNNALTIDYSLFAVEEPNLFIDPCKMVNYYSKSFLESLFNHEAELKSLNLGLLSEFEILLSWAASGLMELQRINLNREVSSIPTSLKDSKSSILPVFVTIWKIIAAGKTARSYWQKNRHSINKFKDNSTVEKAVVERWSKLLAQIEEGLVKVSCRPDIHESLGRFAANDYLMHDPV
ncbi:BgTH12-00849 [Blumeria graminis f. sp. triticale]|uniref:BgTH12-00849 n=1 Tax=Blumeria graminis f. sp. triticale TaxID=1689686 RepID=A0A9W4GHX8_BLUGR|nr:BgTH12-00849 [Blumeria graminis f. sp. triticale]